jgi:hypothetical protein
MLVDYNLEIRKLSVQLQTRIETWIRQESEYGESVELRVSREVPLETAYVLRCPKLHVISEHELKSRIDGNGDVSLYFTWPFPPLTLLFYLSATLPT